jgi:translocation and assembly module TamB
VQELAIGEGELAVASRAPFEVSVARGVIALAGVPLHGPKLSFALGADGSLAHGVRVFVDGAAPAGLLAKLNPLITAFGELALHLELRPDAHPWLQGHAEARDVLVEIVHGGLTSKLLGSASLQGDRVQFQDVTLGLGGGTLGLSGEVVLDGLRLGSYDLQLRAQGVALEVQPHFEIAFDANGRLAWSRSAAIPALSGTLKLHRFYYSRHIPLPEALTAMNRDERRDRAAYAAALDRVQLDLAIEHDAPLLVRNNLLDAELAAAGPEHRLHVVGTDQRFGLLGKLAVTRGRVLYRGDEFQITRGEIAFNDKKRVDPSFDVHAVATGRKHPDSSVVFSARGDRDAFDLNVHCENADVAAPPPPFSCDYKNDNLRCDSFEQLVALWVCRAGDKLSRADRAGADDEAR